MFVHRLDEVAIVFEDETRFAILARVLLDVGLHVLRDVLIFRKLFQQVKYLVFGQANTHRGVERIRREHVFVDVGRSAGRLGDRNEELCSLPSERREGLKENAVVRGNPDGAFLMILLQLDLRVVMEH